MSMSQYENSTVEPGNSASSNNNASADTPVTFDPTYTSTNFAGFSISVDIVNGDKHLGANWQSFVAWISKFKLQRLGSRWVQQNTVPNVRRLGVRECHADAPLDRKSIWLDSHLVRSGGRGRPNYGRESL